MFLLLLMLILQQIILLVLLLLLPSTYLLDCLHTTYLLIFINLATARRLLAQYLKMTNSYYLLFSPTHDLKLIYCLFDYFFTIYLQLTYFTNFTYNLNPVDLCPLLSHDPLCIMYFIRITIVVH